MVFFDRKEAGRMLGEHLKERVGRVDLVLGIPRGGVVVAREVARALGSPMSLLIVRKLGLPSNPEFAFGAIDPDGHIYTDSGVVEYFRLSQEDINRVAQEELRKIREREKRFLGGEALDVSGKVVLVVDDGIATGHTVRAGVEYLKRRGASKIAVAAPVCHAHSVKKLVQQVDDLFCLQVSDDLSFAVGMFYENFRQVEDEEVMRIMAEV